MKDILEKSIHEGATLRNESWLETIEIHSTKATSCNNSAAIMLIPELLTNIFSLLSIKDLFRCMLVCKQWNELASSDTVLF